MSLGRLKPLFPAVIALLVYLNSYPAAFQFDDYNVIVNNPTVHSWGGWLADLPHGIRPLLKLTYLLNWISGFGVVGFHLVNSVIHAGNSCLVYSLTARLLQRISPSDSRPEKFLSLPLVTAIIFAVHPVQTEAVTYICGRSTSLMALFYLGSLLTYAHGTRDGNRLDLYVASPLLFLCALLTKETAVTLPVALLLWEAASPEAFAWRDIARKQRFYWGILLLAALALLLHARYRGLLNFSITTRPIGVNLLTEINGITYLITRLFFVTRLNIDPDLPVITEWSPPVTIEAFLLCSVLGTGILLMRRSPVVGFGIIWFILHLLPTNSFIPRLDVANERQLYLPDWGAFLVIGYCMERLYRSATRWCLPVRAICFAVILLLMAATIQRNRIYQSEITLWEDVARKSPRKARAFNNLGYAYALAGRTSDAEKAFSTALTLDPDFEKARTNLADVRRYRSIDLMLRLRQQRLSLP